MWGCHKPSICLRKKVISDKYNKAELNNVFYSFKLVSVLKTQIPELTGSGITGFSKGCFHLIYILLHLRFI